MLHAKLSFVVVAAAKIHFSMCFHIQAGTRILLAIFCAICVAAAETRGLSFRALEITFNLTNDVNSKECHATRLESSTAKCDSQLSNSMEIATLLLPIAVRLCGQCTLCEQKYRTLALTASTCTRFNAFQKPTNKSPFHVRIAGPAENF